MRWFAQIAFQVKSLFSKRKLDEQLSEEIRTHVAMATEANVAAGMTPEEARYAALRQFGNVAAIQQQAREGRGWVWLEQARQDVGYACRQLAKARGFTAVVMLTLALGIGGTTALFSVVNTVILHPVAGEAPDRLVQIGQINTTRERDYFRGTCPPVRDALLAQREQFDALVFSQPANLDRKNEEFVKTERGAYVSPDFFQVMQCQPLLGRGFLADEAMTLDQGAPSRDTTIVLSYAWWRSQWAGDEGILGRKIELGGRQFTVIGVMPEHFRFPENTTQYWLPCDRVTTRPNFTSMPIGHAFGRLKPGASIQSIQAKLDVVAKQLMGEYRAATAYGGLWRLNPTGLRLSVRPMVQMFQDDGNWLQLRQSLLGLLAAVCFVLLIVCANVANLLLARVERRQHELAIRAAVGAGRGRLLRQLMAENLLLALLGGAGGFVVAWWGLGLLLAMNAMPRLRPVGIDLAMLALTLAISLATALFFGLIPAWRGARVRVNEFLADGGVNATGGRKGGFFRDGLVVVQVAVAIVLLSGAGLMWASVSRILSIDPGFDPENLLLVEVQLPWNPGQKRADREKTKQALVSQLIERFTALPGVQAVGARETSFAQSIEFAGRKDGFVAQHLLASSGDEDVFRVMRMPVVKGRSFIAADNARPEVVIVNETLARQLWPGESAIGKKFGAGDAKSKPFEVVGVVGDVRFYGYLAMSTPDIYHPLRVEWNQTNFIGGAGTQFVIRTGGRPDLLIAPIRHELRQAGQTLMTPVFKIAQDVLYDSTLAQRTYRNYLGGFALLGLLLAALGVYGVLTFVVTRRTREIGIRMAIGADGAEVRDMIMRQGGVLVLLGCFLGLGGVICLRGVLQSQLFDVSATDPVALSAALLTLVVSALFACWLPARRAAKVDPMVALRAE